MSGSCWRLLAVCSLVFVAPILLGQDRAADRLPADGRVVTPILAPHLPPPRDRPLGPVRIPVPPRLQPSPVVPANTGLPPDVFEQLVRTAGIIFSGRITSVGTSASSPGAGHASTVITFQVEHAMLGTRAGQDLTIHEWGGLWARGERYRVGERVLLFLYAPGKLGLTSPVAGSMGRFAMDSQGKVVLSPQQIAMFAADGVLRGKTVLSGSDFARAVQRVLPRGAMEP